MSNPSDLRQQFSQALKKFDGETNQYDKHYKGCKDFVASHGQAAVFFLKRRGEPNTIKDFRRFAAEAAIREFEEAREIDSSTRSERRANLALGVSLLALLLSAFSVFAD